MISRVLTFTNRLKVYKFPAWPTLIKKLPSRESVVKNTLVCVVFCGAGDVLAQVSTIGAFHKQPHDQASLNDFDMCTLWNMSDIDCTCHMASCAAFMGPWFAWWYPYLARNYASIWTQLALELMSGPVLLLLLQ